MENFKVSCFFIESADIDRNVRKFIESVFYHYKNNPDSSFTIKQLIYSQLLEVENTPNIDTNTLYLGAFSALNSLYGFIESDLDKSSLYPESSQDKINDTIEKELKEIKVYTPIKQAIKSTSIYNALDLRGLDNFISNEVSNYVLESTSDFYNDTDREDFYEFFSSKIIEEAREGKEWQKENGFEVDQDLDNLLTGKGGNEDLDDAQALTEAVQADIEELEGREVNLTNTALIEELNLNFGSISGNTHTIINQDEYNRLFQETYKRDIIGFNLGYLRYLNYNPNVRSVIVKNKDGKRIGDQYKFNYKLDDGVVFNVTVSADIDGGNVTINVFNINSNTTNTYTSFKDFATSLGSSTHAYIEPETKPTSKEQLAEGGRGLAYSNIIPNEDKGTSMLSGSPKATAIKYALKLKNKLISGLLNQIKIFPETSQSLTTQSSTITSPDIITRLRSILKNDSVVDSIPSDSTTRMYFTIDNTNYTNEKLSQIHYTNSLDEELTYLPNRLKLVVEVLDSQGNIVEVTVSGAKVPLRLDISNLDIPLPNSRIASYESNSYGAKYGELQTKVENAANKQHVVSSVAFNPRKDKDTVGSIYQPVQYYNQEDDTIKQYRIHYNELYRLGNDAPLSPTEIDEVLNNPLVLKGIGYDYGAYVKPFDVGTRFEAANTDINNAIAGLDDSIVHKENSIAYLRANIDNPEVREELQQRIKRPLYLPVVVYKEFLNEIGFTTEQLINAQEEKGKNGIEQSGRPMLVHTLNSNVQSQLESKNVFFEESSSKIVSSDYDVSMSYLTRDSLVFNDILAKAKEVQEKEGAEKYQVLREVFNYTQSPYMMYQLFEYIQYLEQNNPNAELQASIQKVKAALLDPEDHYDVSVPYLTDPNLMITKEMSEANDQESIKGILLTRAAKIVGTIAESLPTEKEGRIFISNVDKFNHSTPFDGDKSRLPVLFKSEISTEINKTQSFVDVTYTGVDTELKSLRFRRIFNRFEDSRHIVKHEYLILVSDLNLDSSTIAALEEKGKIETYIGTDIKYISIRKNTKDAPLFRTWYSVDGKHQYIGAIFSRGGTFVIDSGYSKEYIQYVNSKYDKLTDSSITPEVDKLDFISKASQRLFGSLSTLTLEGDKIKTVYPKEDGKSIMDHKLNQVVVEKAPHLYGTGTDRYGKLVPLEVRYKAKRGGMRNNDIIEFFTTVEKAMSNNPEVLHELNTNQELNKVSVEFNPIAGQNDANTNRYSSPRNLRELDSLQYLSTNIYPMFPHLVIDLPLNQANFELTDTRPKTRESAPTNTVSSTPDADQKSKSSDTPLPKIARDRRNKLNKGIKFGKIDTELVTEYNVSKDDIKDIYLSMLGITPTFISQDNYNTLSSSAKKSTFYVIESESKFYIPTTENGVKEIKTYVGYAVKGANALFNPDGKFSALVARHEILHTILNEYITQDRKNSILKSVRKVMAKDPNYKSTDTSLLSNKEVEEYLVLKLESLNLGNKLAQSKDTKQYIDNSTVGRFVNTVLGKENVVSKFMYWISDLYKTAKTLVSNLRTSEFNDVTLNRFLFDLSINRFSSQANSYDNFNEDGDTELDIRGRLEDKEAIKVSQGIRESFQNTLIPEEDRVAAGRRSYREAEKNVKEQVVAAQFASVPLDLYKSRITAKQLIKVLETDYVDFILDNSEDFADRFDIETFVNSELFTQLDAVSKGLIEFDNREDAKDFYNNLKVAYIKAFSSIEDFNSEPIFDHIFMAISILENKQDIFTTIFDNIEFDSWLDTTTDGNDDAEEITNTLGWHNRDANHLSTFDTLSKKVQNYVYNTSYMLNGTKKYVNTQTTQSILVNIFQKAHLLDEKGQNKRLSSLYIAFEQELIDLGNSSPNSYVYHEARAIYDKIFKLDDTIPIVAESGYVSSYPYSYAQVAFNNADIVANKPLDPYIKSITEKETELQRILNKLNNNEEINEERLSSLIESAVNVIQTTGTSLFAFMNVDTTSIYEDLEEFNNVVSDENSTSIDIVESLLDALDSITSSLEVIAQSPNSATVHLHQDAFNAIVSMYYSNWRVDFIKASLNKNGVREHSMYGPGQATKIRLSANSAILNTTLTNGIVNADTAAVFLDAKSIERVGFSFQATADTLTFNFPLGSVVNSNKNTIGTSATIKINARDLSKSENGTYSNIDKKALSTIRENLGTDDLVTIVSNYLAHIGSGIARDAVRAFVVQAQKGKNKIIIEQDLNNLLDFVLESYALLAANHQSNTIGTMPLILAALSQTKNDVKIQSILDKGGKVTSTLNEAIKVDMLIYSPTRDRNKILERLIEINQRYRQSVEKSRFNTLDGGHSADKPTTPLYEHLSKLRISQESSIGKALAGLYKLVSIGTISKEEAIAKKNAILDKYKFLHSKLYKNKLFNIKLYDSDFSRDRDVKEFGIFNYITNTTAGKGKSFLNLSPKETMRQFISDFFLYGGTAETGVNNKFGNYRKSKSSRYKQYLEPQAARGALPIVEIDDKIFYDYEGRDKKLGIANGQKDKEYNLGFRYESELNNIYNGSINYGDKIIREIKEITDSNEDLGIYINTHYLDILTKDLDVFALESEASLNDVLLSYNSLVDKYSRTEKEVNDFTKETVLNRFAEVISNLQNDLNTTTSQTIKDAIQKEIDIFTDLSENEAKLDKYMIQESIIYKELIEARIKEAKHIIFTLSNNATGEDMPVETTNLGLLYAELNIGFGTDGYLPISSEVLIKNLNESTNAKVKQEYQYIPAVTEFATRRVSNSLTFIMSKYNYDVSNLDSPSKNKLFGKLTANRHYDKNTSMFRYDGKLYYNTEPTSFQDLLNTIARADATQAAMLKDFEGIKNILSKKNLTITDLRRVSKQQTSRYNEEFEAYIKSNNLKEHLIGTSRSGVESMLLVYDALDSKLIKKIEIVKVNSISPLLYQDLEQSFASYVTKTKEEMVRFAKMAIENEITIDGLHVIKRFKKADGGVGAKVSRIPKLVQENNRYENALMPYAGAMIAVLNEQGTLVEAPNTVEQKSPQHIVKKEHTITTRGKTFTRRPGDTVSTDKGFIYYKDNSNTENDLGERIERMYVGSAIFFGEEGVGMEEFDQLSLDGQLRQINPVALDFYATSSINGFYLGQYIDGDIYRYKGRDYTAKVKDMVKRIGTNTTPGTRGINREAVKKNGVDIIFNNTALSTHHNNANLPDEVYNIYDEQYKYFLDTYADTYTNKEALKAIEENLKEFGHIDESVKLTENVLSNLLAEDTNSKGKIYKRRDVRYLIQEVNGENIVVIDSNNKGTIIGTSGEDIEAFDAWDGVTFTSTLFRMLTMNSFGNQEGIDMSNQGYKLILNNLDEKNQDGISMKSLQSGLTSNFVYDAEDSVKVMIKEGYRTGILNETFKKNHTYKKGDTYINYDGQVLEFSKDQSVLVNSGEWDNTGRFVAPQLRQDVNGNWITEPRNKTLYDIYWENGGWNPNLKGKFDYVIFNGSTTEVDPKRPELGTKISKSDFEVFKAYVKNRDANNFLIKDNKTNSFTTIKSLLEKVKLESSYDLQMDLGLDVKNNYLDQEVLNNLTENDLLNRVLESNRFLYMDSVMLFNPGNSIKKGARTSNPKFKGEYNNEFENIHTQSLESLAYIITINKKDKKDQDVALSSQFTYLAGAEDNYLEAQKAYDMISKLSKVERDQFVNSINNFKREMREDKNFMIKVTEHYSRLNSDLSLLAQLSQAEINLLQNDFDLNSNEVSIDKDGNQTILPTVKPDPYVIFGGKNPGLRLSDSQIKLLGDRFLDKLAFKKHVFGIIKSSAESKKEFSEIWEYTAEGYADPTALSLSNPILFNKIFSEVASIMSKAMALRVNGKKAVQMPITQMKYYYEDKNGKVRSKLDLLRIELKSKVYTNVNEAIREVDSKISNGLYTKRNLKYGEEQGDIITHTEVEASNPLAASYESLKNKTLREVFDVSSTLSFESKTYNDINNVVNRVKGLVTQENLTSTTILRNDIVNSSFFTILLEEVQQRFDKLQRTEKLVELDRQGKIGTKGEPTLLLLEARQEAIQKLNDKRNELTLKLTEDVTRSEKNKIDKELEKIEVRIQRIKNNEDTKDVMRQVRSDYKSNLGALKQTEEYLAFLKFLKEGTGQELSSPQYKELFKKLNSDYSTKVQLVNKGLYGIMSRVPNTGLNSNSFFKIVSFNNEYGNSIFTPAEWLNISGSDHDGDTLQLWQFDSTGKNKPSDQALEVFTSIMTNAKNAKIIFSKLDLSLIPIHDKADAKYKQKGMYLKPYEPWSFFTILSQNAVGTNVVGASALLGKNFTYTNQVIKRIQDFINLQERINSSNVSPQKSKVDTIRRIKEIEEGNDKTDLSDGISNAVYVRIPSLDTNQYVTSSDIIIENGKSYIKDEEGNRLEVSIDQQAKTKEEREAITFSYKGTSITTEFPLTEEQSLGLRQLIDFIDKDYNPNDIDSKYVTIEGQKSVGKSTLIKYLKKYMKDRVSIVYTAPNTTSAIDLAIENVSTGNTQLPLALDTLYTQNERNGKFLIKDEVSRLFKRGTRVILIDQASMISSELNKLEQAAQEEYIKVIYVGDSKQSSSNGEQEVSKVFSKYAQVKLTEVADQSNLGRVDFLNDVRESTDFIIPKIDSDTDLANKIIQDEVSTLDQYITKYVKNSLEDSIILTANRNEANLYNSIVREVLGHTEDLKVGESIVGAEENLNSSISNGNVAKGVRYQVESVKKEDTHMKIISTNSKLSKLAATGIQVSNKVTSDYYQLSRDDVFNFNVLSNEDLENNNQLLSSEFKAIYNTLQGINDNTIVKALGQADIQRRLNKLSSIAVGADYYYNNETDRMERGTSPVEELNLTKSVDFGYAQTIQQAQGTTYKNVVYLADSIMSEFNDSITLNGEVLSTNQQALNYTALSISSDNLIILGNTNIFTDTKEEFNKEIVEALMQDPISVLKALAEIEISKEEILKLLEQTNFTAEEQGKLFNKFCKSI